MNLETTLSKYGINGFNLFNPRYKWTDGAANLEANIGGKNPYVTLGTGVRYRNWWR
jgi:hypothetical protein